MDFRQLEMFRSVAEHGTFTRAAAHLHVSQSAVSRQVKLLEEELGQVLLHRGAHAVTLTEAGELLLKTANRVQRELQDAVWQISERQRLGGGSLHLGGGMTVCMFVLPRLLKKFRTLYGGVDLQVTSGTSEAILRLLRQHEVDLGLLTLPIVASDLEGVPARVAMETENVEIIKAMVASGLGITVIPFAAVARDVRQGRFACARVKGRRLYRETGWVYPRSDYVPRAVTELLRLFDEMKGQFTGRPRGRSA